MTGIKKEEQNKEIYLGYFDCENEMQALIDSLIEEATEEVTEYAEDRLTGTLYEYKSRVFKEDLK